MLARILILAAAILCLTAMPLRAADTVCIHCHGGQGKEYLRQPVALWSSSVHRQNGISCHDCHGGDPSDAEKAMSPEAGFIGPPKKAEVPAFCGRCHVGVKENYLQSAHGLAFLAGKGPHCVTCHSNHGVQIASPELINEKSCSRCHEYGRAGEIKEAIATTDQLIARLQGELPPLHRQGITTKSLETRLFALRNEFHQLFHAVDVDRIKKESEGYRQQLATIDRELIAIHHQLDRRQRAGAGVVALLLLTGVVAFRLYRTYRPEG